MTSRDEVRTVDVGPDQTASSTDDWFKLARDHEKGAKFYAEDRVSAGQAYVLAGLAVECALKGYIMSVTGMTRWPSPAERPDLHVHAIDRLGLIAGLRVSPSDPVAPAWQIFLRWTIGRRYSVKWMSRKVARDVNEAAFGQDGVVPWLKMLCRKSR